MKNTLLFIFLSLSFILKSPCLLAATPLGEAGTQDSTEAIKRQDLRLQVYPNPSDGKNLQVWLPDVESTSPVWVRIYNIAGEQLYAREYRYTGQALALDLQPGLPNGVYILELTREGQQAYRRFYVQ